MASTGIPLYTSPFYTYTKDLESETFDFTFRWNGRMEQWVMTISNSEDEVLVITPIVPFYPLVERYSLKNPTGEFLLAPFDQTSMQEDIPDPRRIYDTHFLFYTNELE